MTYLTATRCRHCGRNFALLALAALAVDAGGSASYDPIKCDAREDGGDHDFTFDAKTENKNAKNT